MLDADLRAKSVRCCNLCGYPHLEGGLAICLGVPSFPGDEFVKSRPIIFTLD